MVDDILSGPVEPVGRDMELLAKRLAGAYLRAGDVTSACKMRVCGGGTRFELPDGRFGVAVDGRELRGVIWCKVRGCPKCGGHQVGRRKKIDLLKHWLGLGGMTSLALTADHDRRVTLDSSVLAFRAHVDQLWRSRAWLRYVGREGVSRGAWAVAYEVAWTGGLRNIHAHVLAMPVSGAVLDDVSVTWARVSGGAVVVDNESRDDEAYARYFTKDFGGTAKHGSVLALASDRDLDGLLRLLIGSGTASKKNGFRFVQVYGDMRESGPRRVHKGGTVAPRVELRSLKGARKSLAKKSFCRAGVLDSDGATRFDYVGVPVRGAS